MANKVKAAFLSYVTHSAHLNYGATLHGYAFQKVLDKLGCTNVVIDYLAKPVEGDNLKYPILNREVGRSLPIWIAVKLNYLISFFTNIEKYVKFKRFIKDNLRITSRFFDYKTLASCESLVEDPDVFVCESDVVWKYLNGSNYDSNFFLQFPAAAGKKKVAYAPTISSHEFDDEIKLKFQSLTKDFYGISSREEIGGNYMGGVLNRNVPWVLDPTLLLDSADYDKVLTRPKESDYLLIYNCTSNDRAMVADACRYAKAHNLEVIEISNYAINCFSPLHAVKCNVGIEEWLGYVKYSKIIISNSFHGLCFAIIFKKDIYLYQRNRDDNRMPNLVDKFGMRNCFLEVDNRVLPNNPPIIDYDDVYKRLAGYRDSSLDFIRKNIIN